MSAIDDIRSAVARERTVSASAIALLQGLKAKLDELVANGNNDPALIELASSLNTDSDSLAAAVTANTPASDQPAPDQGGNTDQGADTGDTTGQPGEPA